MNIRFYFNVTQYSWAQTQHFETESVKGAYVPTLRQQTQPHLSHRDSLCLLFHFSLDLWAANTDKHLTFYSPRQCMRSLCNPRGNTHIPLNHSVLEHFLSVGFHSQLGHFSNGTYFQIPKCGSRWFKSCLTSISIAFPNMERTNIGLISSPCLFCNPQWYHA